MYPRSQPVDTDVTVSDTERPDSPWPPTWVPIARAILILLYAVVLYSILGSVFNGRVKGQEPAGVPAIRFPALSTPVPADSPAKLTADRMYVIDSDIPLIVLASPDGILRVTDEPGPLRIRGKFADGSDRVETRNYTGKHIYTVDVVDGKSGRVELIVIPKGVESADKIIRRLIDANVSPQPPPVPPTPVPPRPDPSPPADRELWLIVVEETADRTPETAKLLNDFRFWDGLTARGHKARFYDSDSPDAKSRGYITKVTERPGLLILSQSGEVVSSGKLPADVAGVNAAIKKAGGK